ncbi:MAG: NADP-dependent isocitrate dehydrogenase, partial [Bacteroidia bacterium]|nr:NADP-dependent isocitrate dehydrogenase [Bacteroidia bacterium]
YWAQALATQSRDETLRERFSKVAKELKENEQRILDELNAAQGAPVDIGGYYEPVDDLVIAQMRPSVTLNNIISQV